jgi:hypothetical protein
MAKQRKSKTTTTSGKLEAPYVFWAPPESHPAQVSGLFQDDPTFEEFCAILRQQRAEDYRRAHEAIDAMIRKEEEANSVHLRHRRNHARSKRAPGPQSQSE